MQTNYHSGQSSYLQTETTKSSPEAASIESTLAETLEQKMAKYFADCKYKIKKNWRSHSKVIYLRIDTKFRIHFDGAITDVVITKSSSFQIEDNLALAAIRRVIPLPHFPAGAPLYYDIDFVFELSPVRTNEAVETAVNLGPPKRKSLPNEARPLVQPPPLHHSPDVHHGPDGVPSQSR